MRKIAWFSVIGVLAFIYIAPSIPGLQVLPVMAHLLSVTSRMDFIFLRLSNWIVRHLPFNGEFFTPIDTVFQDFLYYLRGNPELVEFFLRKLAHVIVFFTLTLMLFFLTIQYVSSKTLALLVSFTGGLVCSVIDEIRQSFIPDRVGSLSDVLINMIGVSFAVFIILLVLIITSGDWQRFFKTPISKNKKSSLK